MIATRALFTAALGGMLTLPSMCNVYRSDVGKFCDAEQLSQGSLKASRAALFAWMERSAASSEGVILARNLEARDTHGIGIQLHDEARKVGLTACALADQADMQAKDEDFHTDLVNMCSGNAPKNDGSVARLDIISADDAERMREIHEWSEANARSPDTAGVVAKIGAAQPRQRGAVLRAEVAKVGITSCLMASTLDSPPPSAVPADAHPVNPNFTVLKVDGPSKNAFPIARALVSHDVAAAINTCYALALAGTPTLGGKIVMKLTLDSVGHVLKASDDGSALKGSLLQCVSTAMFGLSPGAALPDGGKKGAKATVTLQLTPSTSGPGYNATIDPVLLAKSTPKHK